MKDSGPIPPDVVEVAEEDADHIDDWKDQTHGIDRVISVALTLDEARTAEDISDQAHVSPSTARGHLDRLVDLRILSAVEQRGTKTYQPDSAYQHFTEISRLVESHTREDLQQIVIAAKKEIEGIQEQYGCEKPGELRSLATDQGTTAADAKEYFKRASEWDHHIEMVALAEEALERYSEFNDATDSTDDSHSPASA